MTSDDQLDLSPFEDEESAAAFLRDAVTLSSLDGEKFTQIVNDLKQANGLLAPMRFDRILRDAKLDEDAILAIERLAVSVDPDGNWNHFLDFVRRAGLHYNIGKERLDKLESNLALFWELHERLRELQKANTIARAAGNEILSLGLICDSRPVYDEARESILGFVPLVQATISYVTQADKELVLELSLTERDLEFMIDSLISARNKLDILKAAIEPGE